MLCSTSFALTFIITCATSARIQIRAPCDAGHALCFPEEATTNELPSVGSELSDLLEDLILSVHQTENYKRDLKQVDATLAARAPGEDLCCKWEFVDQRI